MIFKEQIKQDQERILQLLEKIYELERRLTSSNQEIGKLMVQIEDLEQTTARQCLGGDISKGMDNDVPPEKRPEIKASRKRIKAATNLFEKNFDEQGNPTTDLGDALTRRYGGVL